MIDSVCKAEYNAALDAVKKVMWLWTPAYQAYSTHYHLVWEIMNRDDVELQKIDKKENLAELFIKTLEIKEFVDFK